MDNLTDCAPADKGLATIPTVSGPDDYGPVYPEDWVANVNATRMWRSVYPAQQFDNLLADMANMTACTGANATADSDLSLQGLCCASMNDMLQAATLISDSMALVYIGRYTGDYPLKAAAAVASSPATASDQGHYLMLATAADALNQLWPFVADDAVCSAELDAFYHELLSPHMDYIMMSVEDPETTTPDEVTFLSQMAASPLLRYAALPRVTNATQSGARRRSRALLQTAELFEAPPPAGDLPEDTPSSSEYGYDYFPAEAPGSANLDTPPAADVPAPAPAPGPSPAAESSVPLAGNSTLQGELCSQLLNTPLWQNYINPGGNDTAVDPGTPTPSPDLLPAVYAVAAAMPDACFGAISGPLQASSLAVQMAGSVLPSGEEDYSFVITSALAQCWLYDPSEAEAYRCAYAMPSGPNATEITRAVALNQATSDDPMAKQLMYAQRIFLFEDLQPLLLALHTSIRLDGYLQLVEDLETEGYWNTIGADTGCAALDLLRPAITTEERAALQQLLDGNAQACDGDVRTRAFGKMSQAESVADAVGQAACSWLSSRQMR